MDLNTVNIGAMTIGQQVRSSSPAERQRLRQEGKCVRYGSQDHWVKDCYIRPFSSSGRKVTISALDDDSISLSGSDIEELEAMERAERQYKLLSAWGQAFSKGGVMSRVYTWPGEPSVKPNLYQVWGYTLASPLFSSSLFSFRSSIEPPLTLLIIRYTVLAVR